MAKMNKLPDVTKNMPNFEAKFWSGENLNVKTFVLPDSRAINNLFDMYKVTLYKLYAVPVRVCSTRESYPQYP